MRNLKTDRFCKHNTVRFCFVKLYKISNVYVVTTKENKNFYYLLINNAGISLYVKNVCQKSIKCIYVKHINNTPIHLMK